MSQEKDIQEVSSSEPVINSDVFQVSTQLDFSDIVTMFVKCEDGVACLHNLNANETVYITDTVVSNEASDSMCCPSSENTLALN